MRIREIGGAIQYIGAVVIMAVILSVALLGFIIYDQGSAYGIYPPGMDRDDCIGSLTVSVLFSASEWIDSGKLELDRIDSFSTSYTEMEEAQTETDFKFPLDIENGYYRLTITVTSVGGGYQMKWSMVMNQDYLQSIPSDFDPVNPDFPTRGVMLNSTMPEPFFIDAYGHYSISILLESKSGDGNDFCPLDSIGRTITISEE